MSTDDVYAREEHFRRLVGKLPPMDPVDLRRIDGTTAVGRRQLLSARDRILATASKARGNPVVGGVAASILHGNPWFDPAFRVELLRVPSGCGKRLEGRASRRFELAIADVMELDDILVTTPVRTAFDVGRLVPEWRGLGQLDALHRATSFSIPLLNRYILEHKGWRHIRQLRAIAPLIDGRAESPQESCLRLLMIRSDLPTPDLQIPVRDETGRVFARADLGYEELLICIEYDGAEFHSSEARRDRDARRDDKLRNLGWRVIRVDAEKLWDKPWLVLREIEDALRERGAY
ncbi:DUF559 domain-containing protein [Gordonia sp. (in: high G+C Gram-positive bacteria)]|uniref:DUF559 domain-containing protein n=1 Tax=Gordonia sp. (in: high G+C Gram-positive bacteria) TaxID=84139 RepID=UPI0039E3ED49